MINQGIRENTMKALILNSGLGSRMGELTSQQPKCMTKISFHETILSRQLKQLADYGIEEAVITTGAFENVLVNYCYSLELPIHFTFVKNPDYEKTNYIYSIYCAREYLDDDVIFMHGDLIFENEVLERVLGSPFSCMAVSSSKVLSEKDFKAVIKDGRVWKAGTDFFSDAVEARPLYRLRRGEWKLWLDKITEFCECGKKNVYAEDALNELQGACRITALDIRNLLCDEIDNRKDLEAVSGKLKEVQSRKVYMCFSSDILHGGHIAIIKKAQRLGKLIIGVLSDEAVASYKRMPLVPYADRKVMLENIAGVSMVVEQKTLSYKDNLERYRPEIVVHGDDWVSGFQKPVRDETVSLLASYGGKLVEYPYSSQDKYRELEKRVRLDAAMPDIRRGCLRRKLEQKGFVTAMEAHDGLTGLVVENTAVYQNGTARQFDAIWISSLCDSTAKGKPDIELVDMTSRYRTIEDIMEVTSKPVIFDGDTGGRTEHFVYTVRTLERLGVSMVIIEDKTGLKKNSLFGTQISQTQDSISNFCEKIRAGKRAQKTKEFMICARIESLILEQGMDDALERAIAFTDAGADAVMIHSRKKNPAEVFKFLEKFRKRDKITPVVLVPTSFHSVTEEECKNHGANIIIYANQLMRAAVPAIQNAARMILENHRAQECDSMLMPFQDIIRFIPAEE